MSLSNESKAYKAVADYCNAVSRKLGTVYGMRERNDGTKIVLNLTYIDSTDGVIYQGETWENIAGQIEGINHEDR